jgi:hypothetical protein
MIHLEGVVVGPAYDHGMPFLRMFRKWSRQVCGEMPRLKANHCFLLGEMVGDTGIEPVTSSV